MWRFEVQREGHEAEFGVVLPQTKEHQEPPEARRGKDRFFPRALKGVWPCWHLDLELLFCRSVREKASLKALCLALSIHLTTFFLNWTIPHNGIRPHNGWLYPILYFLQEIRHFFLDAIQSINSKQICPNSKSWSSPQTCSCCPFSNSANSIITYPFFYALKKAPYHIH